VSSHVDTSGSSAAPRWARRLADVVWAPTPLIMRRFALAGLLASVFIILTGAAVRLSQSGLGCPDWPQCTAHSLVAGGDSGDSLVHRWVEFGNRLVTDAIFVIAVLVFIAAWRYRPGGQRRRDLFWLAAAQPGFIVVQAIVGGIVVLTRLNPAWVSVHYLASAGLVAATVALYVRCQEGTEPPVRLVRPEVRLMSLAVVGVVALMLAAGTVVTGTGPLAGARSVPEVRAAADGGNAVPRGHWLAAGRPGDRAGTGAPAGVGAAAGGAAGLAAAGAGGGAGGNRVRAVLQRAACGGGLVPRGGRGGGLGDGAAAAVRAQGPGPGLH
jgi:heme A synthase